MSKRAGSYGKHITRFLLYALLMFIAVAIHIGVTFLIFGFDTALFYEASYWINTALIAVANVTMGVSVISTTYDTLELTEPVFLDVEGTIRTAAKDIQGNDFSSDIEKLNWSNKVEAWRAKNDVKLINLERKIPHNVSMEIETLEPDKYSNKTKRYVRKRNQLIYNLSDEFINTKLIYQKVKYPEITTNELLYGLQKPKQKGSMLNRNILSFAVLRKVVLGMSLAAISGIASLITAGLNEEWTTFVVHTVINLLTLGVNVTISYLTGRRLHNDRLSNSVVRYGILKDYKDGHYKSLPKVPKRFSLSDKIELNPAKNVDEKVPEILEAA